jgi:uncharacterized protein DUF4304
MLRTQIAPRLRSLGFKGSGAVYVLPDDARWLLIGFQKTYYSRADCVRFTVNLTAADKVMWDEARRRFDWLGIRPTGNSDFAPYSRMIRLGNLMPPNGSDRWWEIGPRRPSKPAASRILKAIESLAVPWLRVGTTRWPELIDAPSATPVKARTS